MSRRGVRPDPVRKGLILAAALLCACAGPKPVLYPNERLTGAPPEAVKADIDDCQAKAKVYVKSQKGKLVARRTGAGAFFGGFIGMVAGAFTGNYTRAVAQGAAMGAATGLAHGAVDANSPDGVHRRFVDLCLGEKGYQPIGWK